MHSVTVEEYTSCVYNIIMVALSHYNYSYTFCDIALPSVAKNEYSIFLIAASSALLESLI